MLRKFSGLYRNMIRSALLSASENTWLRRHATSSRFLRRSVRRFMPGETLEDALGACDNLVKANIAIALTHLGESVVERQEAVVVTEHYLDVLRRIEQSRMPVEISVKLTQLGLDLDFDFCLTNSAKLLTANRDRSTIWIDMEQSSYVDRTLLLVDRARATASKVGVCVQAYLRRTEKDLDGLIAAGVAVRLVKGAYAEPPEIAFSDKREVDENYFHLATKLLGAEARSRGVRAAFATHDRKLVERITTWAKSEGIDRSQLEFQMLYGIQREQQRELARRGYRCRVLISYGNSWFPWYMRRLAERPANLFFVLRNLFAA
jgi:proline dehydrogenase